MLNWIELLTPLSLNRSRANITFIDLFAEPNWIIPNSSVYANFRWFVPFSVFVFLNFLGILPYWPPWPEIFLDRSRGPLQLLYLARDYIRTFRPSAGLPKISRSLSGHWPLEFPDALWPVCVCSQMASNATNLVLMLYGVLELLPHTQDSGADFRSQYLQSRALFRNKLFRLLHPWVHLTYLPTFIKIGIWAVSGHPPFVTFHFHWTEYNYFQMVIRNP